MKYKRFRYLYKKLHLPLDGIALKRLAKVLTRPKETAALEELRKLVDKYKDCPYQVSYCDYHKIQEGLWALVDKYNEDNEWLRGENRMQSRIELNCVLWASPL